MKFKPEDYQTLKQCVETAIKQFSKTIAESREEYKLAGITESRLYWDLFWASKWNIIHYDSYKEGDYTDAHIETAMRKIVKEIDNISETKNV